MRQQRRAAGRYRILKSRQKATDNRRDRMVGRAINDLDFGMLHRHRCADGWGADTRVRAMFTGLVLVQPSRIQSHAVSNEARNFDISGTGPPQATRNPYSKPEQKSTTHGQNNSLPTTCNQLLRAQPAREAGQFWYRESRRNSLCCRLRGEPVICGGSQGENQWTSRPRDGNRH